MPKSQAMKLQAVPFGVSERIVELVNNLSEMEDAFGKGTGTVDLSIVKFVTPLSILPVALYANNFGLTINCTENPNADACSYLDTIGFQKGTTDFRKEDKRYLPITNLSTKEGNKLLDEY